MDENNIDPFLCNLASNLVRKLAMDYSRLPIRPRRLVESSAVLQVIYRFGKSLLRRVPVALSRFVHIFWQPKLVARADSTVNGLCDFRERMSFNVGRLSALCHL